MGKNGVVRGNGDGSGTDDKVPAKLKEGNSEQDVLLQKVSLYCVKTLTKH